MATTAAPTHFPGKALDGARLIDGGIWPTTPPWWPSMGRRPLGRPLDAVHLQRGYDDRPAPPEPATRPGGLIPWARDAVDVLMRASDGATKQIRHSGPDVYCGSTRPCPPGSSSSIRWTPAASLAEPVTKAASREFTRTFADHTAPVYIPCRSPRRTQTWTPWSRCSRCLDGK
jgi:hypothetical protein